MIAVVVVGWLGGQLGLTTRSALAQVTVTPSVTAFVHVNVVAMEEADAILRDQTVVVQDGRIVALGPVAKVSIPDGATRLDGRGKYLIPGLADMHAHLLFNWRDTVSSQIAVALKQALFRFVAEGVTTVRDMWGMPPVLKLKAQVASGAIVGPRLYVSIRPGKEGLDHLSSRPDSAVRLAKVAGYDLIKFRANPRGAVLDSILSAASRVGLPIAGHAPRHDNIQAIQEHYTSVEHLLGLWGRKDVNAVGGEAQIRATAIALKQAGVWVCPTLNHITLAFGSKGLLGFDSTVIYQALSALHEAGVGILAGTDGEGVSRAPSPGYFVADEIVRLAHAGLTPYEALATATRNPAVYLHALDSTGTVAVGKRADLVLLAGNPLADIRQVHQQAGVMVGGQWFSRTALNQLLALLPTLPNDKELFAREAASPKPAKAP